jgi:protein-S-isoprenylcysteine O-methyltransferase Ste14
MMRAQFNQGRPLSVTLLFLAFGLVHSVLAANPVKAAVARAVGERRRNGLYRPFYIVQSVTTTALAARAFVELPDGTIYRARAPYSWLLGAIQAGAGMLLMAALWSTGIGRIVGLPQAVQFARGEMPQPEAEAQGSALAEAGVRGPFRWVRHPENLAVVLLLSAWPRMTVNRLTLAVLATVYAIAGSRHEDARLRAAYGRAFERYAEETPMLLPRVR